MRKSDIINTFISFYENLPKQGTKEWLENRNKRFGGSELAALFGMDMYKEPRDKILEKLGLIESNLEEFRSVVYLNWGNNFEIVHQFILEILFDTIIYELKSIPWHVDKKFDYNNLDNDLIKSSCVHISPDGLAIIKKSRILSLNNNEYIKNYMCEDVLHYLINEHVDVDNNDELFVMFEQKAPYSRELKPTIPLYYQPQVNSGMCVIPFVDLSIYTEAVFRMIRLKEILNNTYNTYDMPFNQKKIKTKPYKRGLIGFYAKLDSDMLPEIINTYKTDSKDLLDLPLDIIFNLFKLVKLRKYVDVKVYLANDDLTNFTINAIKNDENITSNNYMFIGFIGWHLFDITFHFVKPNQNYLHENYDIIHNAHLLINELSNAQPNISRDNIEKKINEFVDKYINNY